MLKILLILPYDTTYKYRTAFIPSISYQPLTLSTLAALIPIELNPQITLVDEGVQTFDYEKGYYDIVGISICTSSSGRGYALAQHFQKKGCYVFMGGHHATLLPEETAQYCDTVFTGSAECTLPRFFADYMDGKVQPRYDATTVCADKIPVARRDLMPRKGYLPQPTIIADYGCSNQCRYCVINSFWGKQAKRPIADVIDELKSLGNKEFLFLDPSPLSDAAYAKELYRELAKLHITWAGLSTLQVSQDDELLELLQKSGCIGLLLGFETFNQTDLIKLAKCKNKVADYKEAVAKLHDKRIPVLGTFMLGLDGDTRESLRSLPDLIADARIDVPRFAILTPYPNTPMFREFEAQGRILTRDWSKYDSIHCVFQPMNMTAQELESEFLRVWRCCYSAGRIAGRLRHTPQRKLTALATNIGFNIYSNHLRGLLG